MRCPRDEQARFAVGARLGLFRELADLGDPVRAARLEGQFAGFEQPDADELLAAATALRARFL